MVHGLETMKRLNDEAVAKHSPLSELKAALQADEYYAWSWHCNLACIGLDSGGDPQSANLCAAQFMKNLFDVDVRTQMAWLGFEAAWANQETSQPSEVAIEIAARVWCDHEMGDVVMDKDAVLEIAKIIDRVKG